VARPALGQETGDRYFIVRDLSAGPETAAAAIRQHVEAEEDWLFLAEFPLKGGEVQAMKICYLPIGADVFAAGLHVAAMMPCGNLAFYEEDGQARLAMLDLDYLTALSPTRTSRARRRRRLRPSRRCSTTALDRAEARAE
jgi:hypothetical protein